MNSMIKLKKKITKNNRIIVKFPNTGRQLVDSMYQYRKCAQEKSKIKTKLNNTTNKV